MRDTGRVALGDPFLDLVRMIVWSPEGQQAAVDGTKSGLSARGGVDGLLTQRFPQAYARPTPELHALVGFEVAAMLRRLGLAE